MADFPLKVLLVAAMFATAACGGKDEVAARGSITVKLPPAHPAVPAPGFGEDTA